MNYYATLANRHATAQEIESFLHGLHSDALEMVGELNDDERRQAEHLAALLQVARVAADTLAEIIGEELDAIDAVQRRNRQEMRSR